MDHDNGIAALARLIERAKRAVVFTGAGISTESGIPDFRSPGGIWTQMAPIYFDEFLASEEARRETWRRRFAMEDIFKAAAPNRGHRAVDALVRRGKVAAVITQNIDGLHEASGIPRDKIIELHGNTTYATCLDCGQRYEIADLRAIFRARRGGAALRQMPRPRQDGDGLVRSGDAGAGHAACRAGDTGSRSVDRARLISGGVSGGWIPGTGEAQRRGTRHRQPRADRPRPYR
jgi:hypothetical protein